MERKAMMKAAFFLTLTLVLFNLLFVDSVEALSLNGQLISPIIYEPGKNITNHYIIADTNLPINISLSGSLLEYISLANVGTDDFDLQINFPQEYISPGTYWFAVTVREKSPEDVAMGAVVSVTRRFRVEVYAYEKEIETSLSALNVNEGSVLPFTLQVVSKGYQDIAEVKAILDLFDVNNHKIGSLYTESRPLKALATETFIIPHDTRGLPPGNYWAEAVVQYDEKSKKVNTSFKIGNANVTLLHYPRVLQQGFQDFILNVSNNWGNPLNDVYAKVALNGQEILQTPSILLNPWEEGMLRGIVKIDLPPGNYTGLISLFFENERSDFPVTMEVLIPASPSPPLPKRDYLLLGSILLLVIIGVIALLYFMLQQKKRGDI